MSRRVTLAVLAASVTQASAIAYQCKSDAECEPYNEQGFEKCGDGGTCISKNSTSKVPRIAKLPEAGCPVDQPTENEKCDGEAPQDYASACTYESCNFACIPSEGKNGRFWTARCMGLSPTECPTEEPTAGTECAEGMPSDGCDYGHANDNGDPCRSWCINKQWDYSCPKPPQRNPGRDGVIELVFVSSSSELACPLGQPEQDTDCKLEEGTVCKYANNGCDVSCANGKWQEPHCMGFGVEPEVLVEPCGEPICPPSGAEVKPAVVEPEVKPTVVEPDVKPTVVEPDVKPTVVEDVKPTPSKKAPDCTPGCKPEPRLMGDDRRHLLFSAMPTSDCPAGCVPDGSLMGDGRA